MDKEKRDLLISTVVLLLSIFVFILLGNLLGVIPGSIFSIVACVILIISWYHYNELDWM